ncbi:MAG: endo-1,4-beta-xylanase [Tannerella sp.]|jgi:GH35 family endo-1,4-beta-xylanase|nr:endo-1,4-beta-xylanase [Tannerella sp.]
MKYINKIIGVVAVAIFAFACTDENSHKLDNLDKPEDVALVEYLNSFDVLKAAVDRNANPNFKIGTSITASDFQKKEMAYSLALTNFDEISAGDAMYHSLSVAEDGAVDVVTAQSFFDEAKTSNISVFGTALVWNFNQSVSLDNSIAPIYTPEIIIPPVSQSGIADLFDFESDNLGDTYPMTVPANGTATVVEDPANAGNKVLSVGSAASPANQSEPVFNIVLPEGIKLKHCSYLILDIYVVNNTGMYGQGLRMRINGKEGTVGTNLQGLGAQNNNWGRNLKVDLSMVPLSTEDKELSEFTLSFGNRTGAGHYLYDNMKMEYATLETGSEDIDFESNNLGDTYPMTVPANGTATVVEDPAQPGNKVLSIGSAASPANQSEPVFNFKMPEGKKLGDCKNLVLDIYVVDNAGIYGQGIRMIINGKEGTGDNFATLGAKNNDWGRNLKVPVSMVPLTEEDKNLNEFTLSFGNRTGGGYYLYDNIRLEWESGSEPTIIPEEIIWKTDDEVKEILANAMESWISKLMEASDGYIKAWDVINEPMDDTNPAELKSDPNPPTDPKNWIADENFYWQDYLGKDYARLAVKFARQYGGNDLKLFVNDYGLEAKDNSKCSGLIEMINYWESDGVTKIDGISTLMTATCSLNPELQSQNEAAIVNMFNLLAQSGKLIRISDLSMNLADARGITITPVAATSDQQLVLSEFYNFIVRKYFEIIPAAQRYGITLKNPIDVNSDHGLWNTSYNRKQTYAGFVEGLKNE